MTDAQDQQHSVLGLLYQHPARQPPRRDAGDAARAAVLVQQAVESVLNPACGGK